MRRSDFRSRRAPNINPREGQPAPRPSKDDGQDKELAAIKEQIANLVDILHPIRGGVADLTAQRDDVTVPKDISQSLKSLHSRLDKIEHQYEALAKNQQKMATTFSNAILKLTDKIEKIAGGEDSEFSLAHSLEQLIDILSNRKLRIVRDNDGNMVRLETVT